MMPLRQAVRAFWTRPQLSLVAVALLALGIGANTTLFALADAVMFRPFPFAEQDRLVIGGGVQAGRRAEIPYPDFIDWRTRAHSFDDLAAMGSSNWNGTLQADEPVPVEYRAVSGNFFDVLGARAAAGRTLTSSDDRQGAALAIVLSHGFWQRRLGSRTDVVGSHIRGAELTGEGLCGLVALAGDRLLILSESGELIIAPASPKEFKPSLRVQILGHGVRSYLALANGFLYARDKQTLACFDLRQH
jgi:hypothetical protein